MYIMSERLSCFSQFLGSKIPLRDFLNGNHTTIKLIVGSFVDRAKAPLTDPAYDPIALLEQVILFKLACNSSLCLQGLIIFRGCPGMEVLAPY